ncbi:MAG: type II toxin-antitoxin system RelB/DinJ family antitoxin [Clostridiales bacterium]|nr:type II toxin-antitoxin system RelB/DinJ family antitoxin [Clostridiales bacterium]
MAKTIQVRVNDQLKESVDSLFTSLGLDTSTAIRMFLVAAMETGGIPFAVMRNIDRDAAIREAVARRKSGGHFYTADEFRANMKAAIWENAHES